MAVFSQRNGYGFANIQIEAASQTMKSRIWAAFYKKEFNIYDTLEWDSYTTGIENMMIEMGVPYEFPENRIYKTNNAKALQRYVLGAPEWYVIFDFLERYLSISKADTVSEMTAIFNHILADEVSGYRVVDKIVVPITNSAEIETIMSAAETQYQSVNTHIKKALTLFADRKKPDYENAIKESISAVEAMCCIITGQSGAQATLGKTIKKLKESNVHIHPAMESAFSSLYGYTSDEDGIRHGGIDFTNAPAEDAKYMLISCSAFINYLIEKWGKAKRQ